MRAGGANYFNPDEETNRLLAANPGMTLEQANSQAWEIGKKLLERAIAVGRNHAFESTLGAKTIPGLLHRAATHGFEVHVWFCGLSSPELHLQRVAARVAAGGHNIPEAKVRERYDASRANVAALAPFLASLTVYDNSADADPKTGQRPTPRKLLQTKDGDVMEFSPPEQTPEWAKPIILAAIHAAAEKKKK